MANQADALVLNYSDRWSTCLLWWKAFFLVPVWAMPVLPFIGSIVALAGAKPLQFAYVFIVVASFCYFIDDILKRKVRIEGDVLQHGFRSRDLSKLLSVGTDYKSSEVLPKKMVLTFSDGKNLQLKLSRINARDYQRFLKHIDNRYSQCRIDPVLSTLINCKKTAKKVLVDDTKRFIIEYRTEQLWRTLYQSFIQTAAPWLRIGPAIVSLLMAGTYLRNTGSFLFATNYSIRQEAESISSEMAASMSTLQSDLFSGLQHNADNIMLWLSNPIIAALAFATLMYLLISGVKRAVSPNSLVIDREGLDLVCSTPVLKTTISRVNWSNVANVTIETPESGHKKIRFELRDKKLFHLDFNSILPDDRPRLARALERFAPGSTIDSNLCEAMMPKQERSYTELWLQSLSTPPERNSLQALASGRTLQNDRYTVLRRLGVGGQGTAYLCCDNLTEKNVVLKETVIPVYAERSIKEQALKRFDHEAKILQSIESEQIVKLEDYFFEDHRGYLVLEHVDGMNLRELVEQEGALAEHRVRDLAKQMCVILSYLHEHKIIHRDFTPDNLLLNSQGRLKLIDFNVAQVEQVGTTGTIAGKHAYLPPEQFRGKATTQSDIYAMGATLYYLLTGKDPEPISQSALAPDTASPALNNIIMDCTALDCSKRFTSTELISERLKQQTEHETSLMRKDEETDLSEESSSGEMLKLQPDENPVPLSAKRKQQEYMEA